MTNYFLIFSNILFDFRFFKRRSLRGGCSRASDDFTWRWFDNCQSEVKRNTLNVITDKGVIQLMWSFWLNPKQLFIKYVICDMDALDLSMLLICLCPKVITVKKQYFQNTLLHYIDGSGSIRETLIETVL